MPFFYDSFKNNKAWRSIHELYSLFFDASVLVLSQSLSVGSVLAAVFSGRSVYLPGTFLAERGRPGPGEAFFSCKHSHTLSFGWLHSPALFQEINCLNSPGDTTGKEKFRKREKGVVTNRFLANVWRPIANTRLSNTSVCFSRRRNKLLPYWVNSLRNYTL